MKRVLVFALLASATALAQPEPEPKPTAPVTKQASPLPPEPKPEDDPWKGRKDLFVPPTAQPTTKVKLGAIERWKMASGLDVMVVPRSTVPVVGVTVAIKAGTDDDPLDRQGLAQFTASMLRKGTKSKSADEIAETVDAVGAHLDASADDEFTTVTCRARSKHLDLCFDMLADVILNPTFPEAEMKEVHDQLTAAVEQSKDNPQQLTSQHAVNLYFGDSDPRGRPMSKRTLGGITREQLVKFHQDWFAPNNALMAVAGDVDVKAMRKKLESSFAAWKKRATPKRVIRKLPSPSKTMAVRLVDKPDATQAYLMIVGPGIARRAPDYYATAITSWALGSGGFSSRLMKVVRSEGGKTYGASSRFDVGLEPGTFTAHTFTRTSEIGNTLKLVADTIEEMRKGGPTDDEIRAAKGNLVGGYGLRLETGGDVAMALLSAELRGIGAKEVELYPAKLAAVTKAQAKKAAADHLKPQSMAVVGKADEVRPLLEKAGYRISEVVKFDEPVSAAERKAMASEKPKGPSLEEIAAGKKLLEEALAAKGGAALATVKDLTMRGKGKLIMRGQTMPITVEEWQVPGKAARQDLAMGGSMKLVQILSEGKLFVGDGAKAQEMPGEQSKKAWRGMFRDANFILLFANGENTKLRAVDNSTIEVISPDGDTTRVELDPRSRLIVGLSHNEEGKETRQEFSDYKDVGGIQFPHRVVQVDGEGRLEVTYEKIELNKNVAPSLFKP